MKFDPTIIEIEKNYTVKYTTKIDYKLIYNDIYSLFKQI